MVRRVQTGPVAGLIAQFVLFTCVAATIGLGPWGWFTGSAYAFATAALLTRAGRDARRERLGPADWVTLSRALLTGVVSVLAAEILVSPAPHSAAAETVLVVTAAVALVLDGVDGRVARRTGTDSAFGARFDMEVDSFLVLVLSVYAVPRLGAWVLLIGGMRYAYVVGSWVCAWMRVRLPARYWRKTVAAIQGVALIVAAADLLATWLTALVVAVALALLVESFARDILWQWSHGRTVEAAPVVPRLRVPRPRVARPGVGRQSETVAAGSPSVGVQRRPVEAGSGAPSGQDDRVRERRHVRAGVAYLDADERRLLRAGVPLHGR